MDFGRHLWSTYLDRFFPADEPPMLDRLRPIDAVEAIWPTLDAIRDRAIIFDGVRTAPEFDEEADDALITLAETGDFGKWDRISAGAWAVLIDRIKWSIAMLTLEDRNPSAFTIPAPRDAPKYIRSIATLLLLLGGPGRTPSAEWRLLQTAEPRTFPPDWPLSRQ